jgi:hypothetical protein
MFTGHAEFMVTTIQRFLGYPLFATALWIGTLCAQESPTLIVVVPGRAELKLTYADLEKMPVQSATVERDGETIYYEGVLLWDILQRAFGVAPGKNLPVNAKLSYVLGTARDGYQAMLAMGEIAPVFAGFKVIVADKRNGGPLLATQQPFQLVAPQDKAQGRAMFSLQRIEVVDISKRPDRP